MSAVKAKKRCLLKPVPGWSDGTVPAARFRKTDWCYDTENFRCVPFGIFWIAGGFAFDVQMC